MIKMMLAGVAKWLRFNARCVLALILLGPVTDALGAPQPKVYLSISPLQTVPMSPDDAKQSVVTPSQFYATSLTSPTSDACRSAGVSLPHGARIKRLFFYLTSDGQSDLYASLARVDLTNNSVSRLFDDTIADNSSTYTYAVFPITTFAMVNNARFAYGFELCLGNGTRFHGAILEYTLP